MNHTTMNPHHHNSVGASMTTTVTASQQPQLISNSCTVPTSVRPKLLQYVEEHMTSLILDAISIQRHSKRARLNTSLPSQQQLQHSSAITTNESLQNNHFFKTRLHAADINLALQLKGCEKLYGCSTVSTNPQQLPNEKIVLTDLLKEETPSPPDEVSMKQHWLVIDGIQPNTTNSNSLQEDSTTAMNNTTVAAGTMMTPSVDFTTTQQSSDVLLRIHQLQSGLLSEELKLYFLRVIQVIEGGNSTHYPNLDNHKQDDDGNDIPQSMYSYYYNRQEQDKVLLQLQIDDGLQELVPFFVRYVQHAIYEHIRSSSSSSSSMQSYHHIESCIIAIRFIRALLRNPTIHLELHLHALLPCLMTCVVAKSFGTSTTTTTDSYHHHYQLRNEAAMTLAICTNVFGNEYTTLKSRILRTLCQALDNNDDDDDDQGESLSSRYGGIVAISLFGNRAIDAFLLPLLFDCWDAWEEELGTTTTSSSSSSKPQQQLTPKALEVDIVMCQRALLNSVTTYLQSTTVEERAERFLDLDLNEVLGSDRIVMFTCDEDVEYNLCFV
jgi:transcription initiation factor TFIID subunit 6